MNRLIDDLLMFSKAQCDIDSKERVDMCAIVTLVMAENVAMSKMKPNVQITHLSDAICDPALIRQVWTNLIPNAIKYSHNNKEASIESRNAPAQRNACLLRKR